MEKPLTKNIKPGKPPPSVRQYEQAGGYQSLRKVLGKMEPREVIDLVNEYAPEHLIIMCRDYGEVGIQIRNAGSVFMGRNTPESAGDYASGTNHTLPTDGHARVYSGLGLVDFQKRISFQEISEQGLKNLGPAIMCMAREEELEEDLLVK